MTTVAPEVDTLKVLMVSVVEPSTNVKPVLPVPLTAKEVKAAPVTVNVPAAALLAIVPAVTVAP
ncbi:MAG: hypothetical protein EBS50_11890 [Sphingomonadaceae bacterium]|nr:hypothetical protein [Sphingomonadaceae bacterium]